MHVAARAPEASSDLAAAVGAVLDRRLLGDSPRPLAVALSGGGDSLALALAAAGWARAAGRKLLILTVDHGLRPESIAWTEACAATAERLGANFQALRWIGEKPATGLPAAARAARHALLAEAARAAGARVILMGHTASDLAEAARMRAAGSTTPDPREWAPSPAWPQGRGVFLLRPMLGLVRTQIRAWLAARGETWIDDPANDDLRYARPRARHADASACPEPNPDPPNATALARACLADEAGRLAMTRADLRAASPTVLARFAAVACLCAAGTSRPPGGDRTARLAARLAGGERFAATLAGARIEADAQAVRFSREPGEAARGGLAPLRLKAGETGVWDGRFEVTAARDLEVRAVGRSTLPDVEDARPLAYERLLAACGVIVREPA
ncbi:tRNA lysidine(34) synthetase TilS [Phenylobacterium sp.]|uniref:tRNA lysidine(34) synthetase TilS n=1 Tax=Phenylobacterium sp. TaxID=1871053 RepID=UPI002F3F5684